MTPLEEVVARLEAERYGRPVREWKPRDADGQAVTVGPTQAWAEHLAELERNVPPLRVVS